MAHDCQYVVAPMRTAKQDEREDGDVPELLVHAATASSRFARFEISISPATSRKLATTLEPPYETNGSVMPVSGMTRSDAADDDERLEARS